MTEIKIGYIITGKNKCELTDGRHQCIPSVFSILQSPIDTVII